MKLTLLTFLALLITFADQSSKKRRLSTLSGKTPLFVRPKSPTPNRSRIGIRPVASDSRASLFNTTNREGKTFLSPLVREIGALHFSGKNKFCENDKGRGRCLYLWECPIDGAIRENIAPCTSHFFQQCCILRDDTVVSTTSTAASNLVSQENFSFPEENSPFSDAKPKNITDSSANGSIQKNLPEKLRPPPLVGFTATPKASKTTPVPSDLFENSFLHPKVYDCGFRPLVIESRIVGGKKSGFGNWPWIASVRKIGSRRDKNGDLHRSGGSLISEEWVITAAHTVARTTRIVVSEAQLLVRLGDYDLKLEDEFLPYVDRKVSKVIVHPEFNAITYENDIALLKLDEKVEFMDNIQPVCLPEPEYANAAEERSRQTEWGKGTLAGWGRVTQGGDQSDVLLDVELPIVTNTKCEEMFSKQNYSEEIPRQFICAGGEDVGGKDSCQGDSGGPMVVKLSFNRWQLVGIVSWGIGCGIPGLPGVLTSVSHYTEWIISNINFFF